MRRCPSTVSSDCSLSMQESILDSMAMWNCVTKGKVQWFVPGRDAMANPKIELEIRLL